MQIIKIKPHHIKSWDNVFKILKHTHNNKIFFIDENFFLNKKIPIICVNNNLVLINKSSCSIIDAVTYETIKCYEKPIIDTFNKMIDNEIKFKRCYKKNCMICLCSKFIFKYQCKYNKCINYVCKYCMDDFIKYDKCMICKQNDL